ncbi:MAG: 50S ribosomal protein L25/general stress protein Ctc [Thiovulaceae bacterium]|nr:50S ribosomal protein L25/general stress protein Ctc [Sulfurimonadaceae bacterium]
MLEGIVRESTVKQATKSLRRDGYLIANIYGKGAENINAAFKSNDFIRTVKAKDKLQFQVKIGKDKHDVVVKEYQVHPLSGDLVHVDLQLAPKGYVTDYLVPVKGVGTPVGVKNKGMLQIAKKRIKVRGAIENMPAAFEINVEKLDLGDAILIRDLEAPKNTTFMDADRVAVLGVIKAK